MLLEDLIASCDGKSSPIRNYSAGELIKATNNFHPTCLIDHDAEFKFKLFRGYLDEGSIIIRKYAKGGWLGRDETTSMAIRDIIVSMQMGTHKNALKLLGCCLEFPVPALVHEYAAKGVLNPQGGLGDTESLPWKTRLQIARQVANAFTYLHTAFPRPIIHRDLKAGCIFLDEDYVPKLSNFSWSITLPPKQLHVEDLVKGTFGYVDPTYQETGYITEKTDVYSFGVLLHIFLTGRKALTENQSLAEYVKLHASDGQYQTIVDANILEEVRGDEQAQQQLQAFLALALSCTQDEREARPFMIDVAKELARINECILP